MIRGELKNLNDIYLDGIALAGYRSFGKELQKIGPLRKINFIIGQNNTGKSNILKYLADHFGYIIKHKTSPNVNDDRSFKELDVNKNLENHKVAFGIAVRHSSHTYNKIYKEKIFPKINQFNGTANYDKCLSVLNNIFKSKSLEFSNDTVWFTYEAVDLNSKYVRAKPIDSLPSEFTHSHEDWRITEEILLGQSYGKTSISVENILNHICPTNLDYPQIRLVPAFREIGNHGTQELLMDGSNIVIHLATLENPDDNEISNRDKFEKICQFVRDVTDLKNAKLTIPYSRDTIKIDNDNLVLPIKSLGTGIHEIIILAAISTIITKEIICIEEPEIHAHPILQRKLINYLNKNTSNQYLIATHSTHILDSIDCAIFHIKYQENCSVVDNIITNWEKFRVCKDLGYKPSDLLQSNCIIWVEGPSDRLYINHWLKQYIKHKNLEIYFEGIDYTIMFYGGGLLSHLTVNGETNEVLDDDTNIFIELKNINRQMFFVIDSDKAKKGARINKTKKRIIEEIKKINANSRAWLTQGREIENYIEADVIEECIKDIHKNVNSIEKKGYFENLLNYRRKGSIDIYSANKIKVAYKVIKKEANLNILDLNKQLSNLYDFIKAANS